MYKLDLGNCSYDSVDFMTNECLCANSLNLGNFYYDSFDFVTSKCLLYVLNISY